MLTPFHWLSQLFSRLVYFLEQAFLRITQPSRHSIVLGTVTDFTRSKAELIAENALLRQQLIVLYRQVTKPAFSQPDWLWFVLLASNCLPRVIFRSTQGCHAIMLTFRSFLLTQCQLAQRAEHTQI